MPNDLRLYIDKQIINYLEILDNLQYHKHNIRLEIDTKSIPAVLNKTMQNYKYII